MRRSNDAGRFVCDYIYYAGLFEYWKRAGAAAGGPRPVMFLHVPAEADDEHVAHGVTVAIGLIRALVASRRAGRRGGEENSGSEA